MKRTTGLCALASAGLAAVLGLSGCGGAGPANVATGPRSGPVEASAPSPAAGLPPNTLPKQNDPETAFGVRPGERIPVGTTKDPSVRGYVDWSVLNGVRAPDLSPIYSAPTGSTVIADWGASVGWLTLDQVNAPGFNLGALQAAQAALNAQASQNIASLQASGQVPTSTAPGSGMP